MKRFTFVQLYLKKCVGEGIITEEEFAEQKMKYDQICEDNFAEATKNPVYVAGLDVEQFFKTW